MLTKGLIALVFPFAAIGAYLFLTGKLRFISKLRLVSSTLVFLAIAAPWHILAALRNPGQGDVHGFLWFYFVNEQFLRYVNKRVPPGYDTVPLFIFWGLTLLWLVPWTFFFPRRCLKCRGAGANCRGNSISGRKLTCCLACGCWSSWDFSASRPGRNTIRSRHCRGMALLVGGWLAKESAADANAAYRRAGRISSAVLFVMVALGSVVGVALLLSSRAPAPGTDLADLLRKNPTEYDLSLGHFLDLTPQALGAFRGAASGDGGFTPAGSGIELAAALAWPAKVGERGTGIDDGGAAGLCTLRPCDFLTDLVFAAAGGGHPAALSAGRHHRGGRPISRGFDPAFLLPACRCAYCMYPAGIYGTDRNFPMRRMCLKRRHRLLRCGRDLRRYFYGPTRTTRKSCMGHPDFYWHAAGESLF